MARKIEVQILGDSSSLERAFDRSARSARKFSLSVGSIVKSGAIFAAIGASVAGLTGIVRAGVSEWTEMAKVAAQTNAVLKSTGGIANVTAGHVDKLANSILGYSGIDDEAVQAGENLLLTFKNVRNEAGKGNAVFDRATKAAVDLSVAGFGSLQTTAKQLGKALNDPVRGMTALGRAGVTFSDAQKKQIKGLVESNRLLDAQKLILREVESQVGGSAKAYGRTLPGQLKKLKEAFRNSLGGVVQAVARPLAAALGHVNAFVTRFQKARGIRAKFNVTVEGLKDIGRQAFKLAEDSIRKIDWQELVATLRDGLFGALSSLGRALDRINFSEVGRQIGRSLADSLATAAKFLDSVDWGVVGQKIVTGISDFIKAVPWNRVADTLVKLLLGALKASAELLLGAGKALGSEIMRGFGIAFESAKKSIMERLLNFVQAVLGVTSFLGRFDPFKGVREKAKKRLDALQADASSTAKAINTSLATIQDVDVTITIDTVATFDGKRRPEEGTSAQSAAQGKARNAISDAKARAAAKSAAATARARAAASAAASSAADKAAQTSRAAATKAAARAKKAAEARDKAFGVLMDSLSLKFDKAQARAGFKDDLAVLAQQEKAVRAQIAAAGKTTELERELFRIFQERSSIQEQIREKQRSDAAKARAKTQARQFKALGLSGEGEEITPGVKNLKKQFASLTDRIAEAPGQVSSKLTSRLAGVKKLLAGAFGSLSEETRKAIADLFATIRGEFDSQDKKGPLTKTSGLNTKKFIEGLGLSGDQARELTGRLSGLNSAGVGAVNAATGSFVGGPITVESHTTVQLDGHTVGKSVTRQQQKRNRRNPAQSRGPNRGGV